MILVCYRLPQSIHQVDVETAVSQSRFTAVSRAGTPVLSTLLWPVITAYHANRPKIGSKFTAVS